MSAFYKVTWHFLGDRNETHERRFNNEPQARNFYHDTISLNRANPSARRLVEIVFGKYEENEIERWQAPGYPF